SASSADSICPSSGGGRSCLTRRPSPGRLATMIVGSAHTSWPRLCSAGTVASRPTCPRTTCDEIARTLAMACLYHVALAERLPLGDAVVSQTRQIDGLEAAVHDQLRHRTSGRRALLRAVSGEPVGEVQVGELRVRADD